MLDSAQKSERGIPQELLDMKKEEIKSRDDDNARLQVGMGSHLIYNSIN